MKTIQKKVCLLGDFAVGKTSLVRRYVEGRFDDRYLSTVGVRISRRMIQREGHELKLLIWDLAGGEDYELRTTGYLRGAAGALVVCDLTRPVTLLTLNRYIEQLAQLAGGAPVVVVANKADLEAEREISSEDLAAAATRWEAPFLLTSAKTGEGVEDAFVLLADRIERGSG